MEMRVLLIEDKGESTRNLMLMLRSYGHKVYYGDLRCEEDELDRIQTPLLLKKDAVSNDRAPAIADKNWNSEVERSGTGLGDEIFGSENSPNDQDGVQFEEFDHPDAVVSFGSIQVNRVERTVKDNGHQINLTRREYEILDLLFMTRGNVLTKEMILNHLYDDVDMPQYKAIDVFICNLRKKLARTGGNRFIKTVWGRGFVLFDPPQKYD